MRYKPLLCCRRLFHTTPAQVQLLLMKTATTRLLASATSQVSIDELYRMSISKKRSFATAPSYDPLARRPSRICDPYGQEGKPLCRQEAESLLSTVEKGWRLVPETHTPTGLIREFHHADFVDGAQFVTKIAAIGQVTNHYPSILLERRLLPNAWQVVTRVECNTPTLKGLSYNDFHVAMLIDVETTRPEVQALIISDEDTSRTVPP